MKRILLIGGVWIVCLTILTLCAKLRGSSDKWEHSRLLNVLMGGCALALFLTSCT
jgi:hypothetical protein